MDSRHHPRGRWKKLAVCGGDTRRVWSRKVVGWASAVMLHTHLVLRARHIVRLSRFGRHVGIGSQRVKAFSLAIHAEAFSTFLHDVFDVARNCLGLLLSFVGAVSLFVFALRGAVLSLIFRFVPFVLLKACDLHSWFSRGAVGMVDGFVSVVLAGDSELQGHEPGGTVVVQGFFGEPGNLPPEFLAFARAEGFVVVESPDVGREEVEGFFFAGVVEVDVFEGGGKVVQFFAFFVVAHEFRGVRGDFLHVGENVCSGGGGGGLERGVSFFDDTLPFFLAGVLDGGVVLDSLLQIPLVAGEFEGGKYDRIGVVAGVPDFFDLGGNAAVRGEEVILDARALGGFAFEFDKGGDAAVLFHVVAGFCHEPARAAVRVLQGDFLAGLERVWLRVFAAKNSVGENPVLVLDGLDQGFLDRDFIISQVEAQFVVTGSLDAQANFAEAGVGRVFVDDAAREIDLVARAGGFRVQGVEGAGFIPADFLNWEFVLDAWYLAEFPG